MFQSLLQLWSVISSPYFHLILSLCLFIHLILKYLNSITLKDNSLIKPKSNNFDAVTQKSTEVLTSPTAYRHPTSRNSTCTLAYHESFSQPRSISGYQRLVKSLEGTVKQLQSQISVQSQTSSDSLLSSPASTSSFTSSSSSSSTFDSNASVNTISTALTPSTESKLNNSNLLTVAAEFFLEENNSTPTKQPFVESISRPSFTSSEQDSTTIATTATTTATTTTTADFVKKTGYALQNAPVSPFSSPTSARPSVASSYSTTSPTTSPSSAGQLSGLYAGLNNSGSSSSSSSIGYNSNSNNNNNSTLETPDCESYLEVKKIKGRGGKSVALSNWKRQYCVLQGMLIFVYPTKPSGSKSTKVPVILDLRRCTVDENREYSKRIFVFSVTLADESEYLLQADTLRDLQMWIQGLKQNRRLQQTTITTTTTTTTTSQRPSEAYSTAVVVASPNSNFYIDSTSSPSPSSSSLTSSPSSFSSLAPVVAVPISPVGGGGGGGGLITIDPATATAIATSQTAAFNSLRKRLLSLQDDLSHIKSGMNEVSQQSKATYTGLVDWMVENAENQIVVNNANL